MLSDMKEADNTPTNRKRTMQSTNDKSVVIPAKKRRKSRAVFVVKLFQFLTSGQQSDIVSWHKESFVVWNRLLFAERVLPLLFSHNKFASFERQTNFYRFAKMSIDEDFSTKKRKRIGKHNPIKYKHPLFFQGASLEQIQSIERETSPFQVQARNVLEEQIKNLLWEEHEQEVQLKRLQHIYQALQEEIRDRRHAASEAQAQEQAKALETEQEQEKMKHQMQNMQPTQHMQQQVRRQIETTAALLSPQQWEIVRNMSPCQWEQHYARMQQNQQLPQQSQQHVSAANGNPVDTLLSHKFLDSIDSIDSIDMMTFDQTINEVQNYGSFGTEEESANNFEAMLDDCLILQDFEETLNSRQSEMLFPVNVAIKWS